MKDLNKFQRFGISSVAIFFVLMVIAVFHKDGILTVYQVKEKLNDLEKQNISLREENIQARKEIEELKSNPLAIEKIAREKLDLIKERETVYKLVKKSDLPPIASTLP